MSQKRKQASKALKKKKQTSSALIAIRLAGIGLLIQWLRVMAGISFAWTIWLGYLLIFLGLAEVWLEPLFKDKRLRYLLTAAVVGVGLWFTLAVVLARPNLYYQAWSIGGDYKEFEVIGGILWRPKHFTDLRFEVTNKSDDDYDDVRITFFPDQRTVAIGQITSLPGVAFINNNVIAEAHSSGTRPDGTPAQDQFVRTLARPEVVCSKLHPGEALQIVIAIAQGLGPDLPDNMYGPKIRASKMKIEVKVKRGQQSLTHSEIVGVRPT
jgi:hypothetical protein